MSIRCFRPFACAVMGTLAAALFLSGPADTRPVTNREKLMSISKRLETKWNTGRDGRFEAFLNSTNPMVQARLRDPNLQLMSIDEEGRPVFYRYEDLISAQTISTDEVWAGGGAGFSLDGDRGGLAYLAQWDAGGVLTTHQEFDTRVNQVEPSATHFHSTRVAGIIAASGVNPAAKGMSPAAELYAFTSVGDDAEMAVAAAMDLHVSNHSYSRACGWDLSGGVWTWFGNVLISTQEDPEFGRYTDQCQSWDEIAHNAPWYTIVGGAGNDRSNIPPVGIPHLHSDVMFYNDIHPPDGGATGYDTMPSTKVAKNIITVGGVLDIAGGYAGPGSVVTSSFSSWGPTDDGRIKPDVVANATNLTAPDSGGVTNYATNAAGCSYAGPAVAGSVNLMLQHWNATHGAIEPLSSTVKAVLIHTADEAGNTGPDYTYGWGLVDTREAVELIDADQGFLSERIIEQTLLQAATDTVEFYWGDEAPFSVTMAWTDPPGTPQIPASVDDPTPMLVNDLDLRVRHVASGAAFQPWIMNPANPAGAATRGDNIVDNVEQVRVDSPPTGWYRALITHKGTLDGLEQTYSLIIPARRKICLVAVAVTPGTPGMMPSALQHWAKLDGDDRPDLALTDPAGQVVGFSNQGNGIFSRLDLGPLENLSPISAAAWEDFDNDGDADCVVSREGVGFQVYGNDGVGNFNPEIDADSTCLETPTPPGCDTLRVIATFDADTDGRADILVGNTDGSNFLYRNLGGMSFLKQPLPDLSGFGMTAQFAWANIDGDPRPELFLANSNGPNRLFDATGAAEYSEITIPGTGTASRGAAWGYLDDNAIPDLFVANSGEPDQLILGTQSGFVLANLPPPDPENGSRPGVTMSDVDLDGDVDLLLPHRGRILLNNGDGVFSSGPAVDTGNASSAAWADPVTDGRPDLLLGGIEGARFLLFDPCDATAHWLEIDLVGTVSTRSALGAVVTVEAGAKTLRRQVGTGVGAQAQGPLRLHFGLGAATAVSVRIDWPGGEVTQTGGVAADRVISFVEPGTSAVVDIGEASASRFRLSVSANPLRSSTDLEFQMVKDGRVELNLFSVDGRLVRQLAGDRREAGIHRIHWDGRDARGNHVSNGIYFFRLAAAGQEARARVVVAR